MNDIRRKLINKKSRSSRVRAHIKGSSDRPRLSVKISAKNVSAQIIDDQKHITVASASTIGKNIKGTMTEKAEQIGELIAKEAKTKKVKKVVFDRGPKLYHGRVKALAEAARKNGLEF